VGGKKKNILKEVIAKLKSEKSGYHNINHKRVWLDFLKDGDLFFSPSELKRILEDTIRQENCGPKGSKLFFLRKRYEFTIKTDKTPYRIEEALERFIIASNANKFFNQVPIGGGKESIDIGIGENDSEFTFVELKPWTSTDSPLYAIVESLKNLTEYREILDGKIANIPVFKKINLIVLAPWSYFQAYGLMDSNRKCHSDKISVLKKTFNDLSSEFETNISLMALPLDQGTFNDVCGKIYDRKGITKQTKIDIESEEPLPELKRNRWKLLVSSDKML
jgi:hypothetical protein